MNETCHKHSNHKYNKFKLIILITHLDKKKKKKPLLVFYKSVEKSCYIRINVFTGI